MPSRSTRASLTRGVLVHDSRELERGANLTFLLDRSQLRKISVTRWQVTYRDGPYADRSETVPCPYRRIFVLDTGRRVSLDLDAAPPALREGEHLLGYYEPGVDASTLCVVWHPIREQ